MCDWVQILSNRRSQGCLLLDAVGDAKEDGLAARLDESFARAGLHGTRCPVSLLRCWPACGSFCFFTIIFFLVQILLVELKQTCIDSAEGIQVESVAAQV